MDVLVILNILHILRTLRLSPLHLSALGLLLTLLSSCGRNGCPPALARTHLAQLLAELDDDLVLAGERLLRSLRVADCLLELLSELLGGEFVGRELAFELLLQLCVFLAEGGCLCLELLDPLLFSLSGPPKLVCGSPLLPKLVELLLLILFEVCSVLRELVRELAIVELQIALFCLQICREALVTRDLRLEGCQSLVCARLTLAFALCFEPLQICLALFEPLVNLSESWLDDGGEGLRYFDHI